MASPPRSSVRSPDLPATEMAGRYPPGLTDEDSGEGFLFQGTTPTTTKHGHGKGSSGFRPQPPQLDIAREYEAAGKSYRVARATISTLSERHRQLQVEQEEAFARGQRALQFTANFAETRLATCGTPTLNTMSVRLERQRARAKKLDAARSGGRPPIANKKAREAARREEVAVLARAAVRRAYGSQELDLKALELVHLPRAALFSTLLLQLARTIRTVNVSRNSLRELPEDFVRAFPETETLLCKENALARLPARALGALRYLRVLNASGNELDALPTRLPEALELLDVSRNRLPDVPNLQTLRQLVTLDLSFNHLQLLPRGLMTLHKLQTLVVAGNRLVTLATRSQLAKTSVRDDAPEDEEQDDDVEDEEVLGGEAARSQWRVEVDPVTHDTVYFHLRSQRVSRVKPRCFQVHIPALQLPGRVQKQQKPMDQRAGWDVLLPGEGDASATLHFVNHDTDENFTAMPTALDRLGDVDRLQVLVLSGNELLELPPSLGKLVRLKRLEAENNKLLALPDAFQQLRALESVKLGMNALAALPPSFTQLASLTELDVKFNRLRALPERFGDLRQLRALDVSANALETLPRSFLALRLATLRLASNAPLLRAGFAPETLRTGDLAQVRWQLEHVLECDKHGGKRPPEPQARLVGIGKECWSTDLHVSRDVARAVEAARETRTLALHWRALETAELPSALFRSLPELQELQLSGQKLELLPASFAAFTELRVLQLRQNELRAIAPEVFGASELAPVAADDGGARLGSGKAAGSGVAKLEELDVQYNRLETLPSSLANCSRLRVLRANNNALSELPGPLDGLARGLEELQLAHNRFVAAPRALAALGALQRLDLSFNRLESLGDIDFSCLAHLETLRLSGNRLTDLPPSLGGAGRTAQGRAPPLRELALGGNLLAELPAVVLLLGKTLVRLEVQSNRLERLPASFGAALPALQQVESDGNPFRSPPAEVMRLGAAAIRAYLGKREQRVEELAALLSALGLPYDREAFERPVLRELLPRAAPLASLPFLTTAHLAAFDRAVDGYVNGAFYLPPPPRGTGAELRRGADLVYTLLLRTHFELAQRQHRTVLEELLSLLTLVRAKRWADKTDLRFDLLRPWGRRAELVGVYMLRSSLLFPQEAAAAADGEAGLEELPGILHVVEMRTKHGFPPEPFVENKRSARDVERALEQYVGVFGPVGVSHSRVPLRCSCDGLLRFGKMHEPCAQRGWTLLRVLYTAEEAARREADEKRLQEAQEALLPQIRAFLETPEGQKRFHAEVKRAKDALREELRALQKRHKRATKRWRALAKAQQREDKLQRKLEEKARKLARATGQSEGESVNARPAETLGEVKARAAKREELERRATRVREGQEELARGKARLGQGYAAFREEVERALLETVGSAVRRQLVRQQRDKAIAMGWRRPWDGVDGRAFERYKLQIRRHQLGQEGEEGAAAPDAEAGGESAAEEDADALAASDDNSEISDVSFDGYDDLVANLTRNAGAGELEQEESEEEDEDEDELAAADAARAAALAALAAEEAEESELDDSELDASEESEREHESEDSEL